MPQAATLTMVRLFPFGNLVWVGNDHGSGSGLIAHQSMPDNVPPYISAANPAIDATLQPLSTRIGVALSDSVLMESVNSSSFTVTKIGSSTPLQGSTAPTSDSSTLLHPKHWKRTVFTKSYWKVLRTLLATNGSY